MGKNVCVEGRRLRNRFSKDKHKRTIEELRLIAKGSSIAAWAADALVSMYVYKEIFIYIYIRIFIQYTLGFKCVNKARCWSFCSIQFMGFLA